MGWKTLSIGWTWRGWLGMGGKFLKDPKKLSEVQDSVWNDPRWKADTYPNGKIRTHCNQASLAVANGMGYHGFDSPVGGEPYTADQIFYYFQRAESNFLEKDLDDAQTLANQGSLLFCISPSWILGEDHGHIVSITPGKSVHSENLGKDVPVCLNISTAVLSSRSIGINWAFPMKRVMPKFFVWKDSL